jgi:general secretion pathway protein D
MIKPLKLSLSASLAIVAAISAQAGSYDSYYSTSVSSSAEREVIRRQEYYVRAEEAVRAGDNALAGKDYEVAFAQFRLALDLLGDSPQTRELRADAADGFCVAGVKLAEQRIAEGRFEDAETYAKLILQDRYVPDCKQAIKLLARLEDPEYFNRTITPGFVGKVEEVKELLLEAKGFYDTGRYDMALKRYDQVLNIDPYNIAARKGQEKVHERQSEYAIDGYNRTRAKMLWEADKAWDSPVRKFDVGTTGIIRQDSISQRNNDEMIAKLNRIIIPQIQFRDATVREAIDFLKQKAYELDPETDPAKKGVNIVLKLEPSGAVTAVAPAATPSEPAIPGLEPEPAAAPALVREPGTGPPEARITLSLSNIPMSEALRYIAYLANLKVKVDPYAVSIVPLSEPTDVLITREYRVPPSFLSDAATPAGEADAGEKAAPAAGGEAAKAAPKTESGISKTQTARAILEKSGVTFPTGASAQFLPASSRLIVRNTQENLDLVDTIVEAMVGTPPTQVEIEAKFVEITQTNLKELSFDWLLGAFNIPGSDAVFASGGLPPGATASNYPFINPATGTPIGETPVTSGLRSGTFGINANSIDALLAGGAPSSVAAGVFSIAGVFTDPAFQVVIRALNQKKGVDVLSSPRVTTRSGRLAEIEIVREFIYPTAFSPPQIPQTFGASPTGDFTGTSSNGFPVTPSSPTAFNTRNTGVTLKVTPVVGPDQYTIDLDLSPEVVEFEGFINYGSPIQTSVTNLLGVTSTVVLTENVINQPVFSTSKVNTSVSIWDGQTVVLGGLIREDIQKVEDKVPLLGDIPLVGRLFRSNIDQHTKRNLIIFVSAKLINPAGDPVNLVEEEEETIERIPPPELSPPILPEVPLFKK